jgi:hypothetical protein
MRGNVVRMIAVAESLIGFRNSARCYRDQFCGHRNMRELVSFAAMLRRETANCTTSQSHRDSYFPQSGNRAWSGWPHDQPEHQVHQLVKPPFIRSDL